MSLAKQRCIRLTDPAYEIAIEHAKRKGFSSISEGIEWLLLAEGGKTSQFERRPLTQLMRQRRLEKEPEERRKIGRQPKPE